MKIKKGQMLTFAEGDYSDYCVNGLVVALTEFDLDVVKSDWERYNTKLDKCQYRVRPIRKVFGVDFLPWLVSSGLVEDVDYIEIHTGSYGNSEIYWEREEL